jgi:uncharacterized protein YjbI with pentapeptide repeats
VLKEADLEGAHLDDASLAGARFGDVTSEPLGAIMSAASARATTATGRALPPARLRTRTGPAHLQGATLSRATYTPLTGCPPGFDPAAAGAVLETQNARTTSDLGWHGRQRLAGQVDDGLCDDQIPTSSHLISKMLGR